MQKYHRGDFVEIAEDLGSTSGKKKMRSSITKKKKVKKVKHVCDSDCNNCPNFGTKDCVMIKNKRTKKLNKKKKIIKKIIGKPDKKYV